MVRFILHVAVLYLNNLFYLNHIKNMLNNATVNPRFAGLKIIEYSIYWAAPNV